MLPNASQKVSSFFLFLFAFFQIFMKRFSIYPDTSSPPWVSAGRAQTTNSRRYFPQSSIWLHWQVQRAACWESAEAEGGGTQGGQPRSPQPEHPALGSPGMPWHMGSGHRERAGCIHRLMSHSPEPLWEPRRKTLRASPPASHPSSPLI